MMESTSDAKWVIRGFKSLVNPNWDPTKWVMPDTSHLYFDLAFEELKAPDFLYSLGRGHTRVKRLLSKGPELGEQLNVKLIELEPQFRNLFTSIEKLKKIKEDDAAEIARLLALAKQILGSWEYIENAVGQLEQPRDAMYYMAPVDYPHPVPSAWVLELDWQDQAYEEVLLLRKKFSNLLDQAYSDYYRAYSEKNEVFGSTALSLKKLLNFLGSSREDLALILKEKCYKRVMDIKEFCIRKDKPLDLVSLRASWSHLTNQTQLPNWRDEIYDKIQAARSMYSLKLDLELREVFERLKSETSDDNLKARHSNVVKALAFLSNFRADIALLSEDDCREQLAATELFLESVKDSLPATIAGTSGGTPWLEKASINWRDRAFQQIGDKANKFMFQLYDVYLTYKAMWSKIPEFREEFKKLEVHLENALDSYEIHRGTLSFFKSMHEYFFFLDTLKEYVEESVRLIKHLLLGISEEGYEPKWDCKPEVLVPMKARVYG